MAIGRDRNGANSVVTAQIKSADMVSSARNSSRAETLTLVD
jgi:hypothetical protein